MKSHRERHDEALDRSLKERATADLRKVLATPEGRRVLWSILDGAGLYGLSYTGEALSGAFNEGRRSVGRDLLSRIEADAAGSYLVMQREALDEAVLSENARKAAEEADRAAAE